MSRNKLHIALAVIAVLIVGNLIVNCFANWGLITVKVTDAPIGQVIRSIERQGWVTIYTNIDPQTKVSMYVDHVPLSEAMETLAVNADAQWHLGFFVAPNSAAVKAEIRDFAGGTDDNTKTHTYSYQTPLAMLQGGGGDDDSDTGSAADPRLQNWPGLKMPAPRPAPAADANGGNGGGGGNGGPGGGGFGGPGGNGGPGGGFGGQDAASDDPPSSVQGYLRAFAREADIWIMASADWDPAVAHAPAPNSSIASAVDHFVSSAHGSVTQAIVLRGRPPRVAGEQRPRGERGAGMDFSMMEDRLDNAIRGLPEGQRAAARDALKKEVDFQKQVQQATPDQRMAMMRDHFMSRRTNNMDNMRRSPEKRAQMASRLVSNRMAAQGKK